MQVKEQQGKHIGLWDFSAFVLKKSKVRKRFVTFQLNKISKRSVDFQADKKERFLVKKKIEKSYLIFMNPNIPFLKTAPFQLFDSFIYIII